jgi:hypothetical protein
LAAFTKLQAELKKITDKLQAHQQETKSEHQLQSKMIQTLQNAQNTTQVQHSQDNKARSEITRIKAHITDSEEYIKKRFGQLDHCHNAIQKQEQILGRYHRRQLDLEAKTDRHIQQVTQAMESTNSRINTVTTRTKSLEHCLHKINQRFEESDKQQARAFQAMQHSFEQSQEHNFNRVQEQARQSQEQARQERQTDNVEMKQMMMELFKKYTPPTTLVLPTTSKRSRDPSTLTQSTYETSNLTDEIQAKRSTGKAPKTPKPRATPETEAIDFPPDDEPIAYVMNGMPQDYGQYPDFRDDPDSHDHQL